MCDCVCAFIKKQKKTPIKKRGNKTTARRILTTFIQIGAVTNYLTNLRSHIT